MTAPVPFYFEPFFVSPHVRRGIDDTTARIERTMGTAPTLGEIAELLKPLKEQGVTYESLMYAAQQVWPPEPAQAIQDTGPSWQEVQQAMGGKSLSEQLDDAETGEEFQQAIMGFFRAVDETSE